MWDVPCVQGLRGGGADGGWPRQPALPDLCVQPVWGSGEADAPLVQLAVCTRGGRADVAVRVAELDGDEAPVWVHCRTAAERLGLEFRIRIKL